MALRKFDSRLIQSIWDGLEAGKTIKVKSSPFVIEFCKEQTGAEIIRFEFSVNFPLAAEASTGFDIEIGHQKDSTSLEVIRSNCDDDSMFTIFTSDLVALSTQCADLTQEECANAVVDRITAWQKFMKTAGRKLSDEKELGLLGELVVLQKWLQGGGKPKHLDAVWTGPIRQFNDFTFKRGYGFEVKTSTNATPFRVHVDNLEQLDTGKLPNLSLVAIKVTELPGGRTLLSLIDEINKQLPLKISQLEFMSKLISSGFNPENPTRELREFRVDFIRAFKADSVPRIIPGSIPGILSARYEMLLIGEDGRSVFGAEEQDFEALLHRVITQGV